MEIRLIALNGMLKHYVTTSLLITFSLLFASCIKEEGNGSCNFANEQEYVQSTVPQPAIIAHRGTCYWAPESTEAAMRWARNAGTTYLECDLQRTKDGYIIAYHDISLLRTTNVKDIFPERKQATISDFTLEELFRLDLGSWFNYVIPSNARKSFKGLDILTLEDIIKIAEGYRIKRDSEQKRIYTKVNGRIVTSYEKDPADNGNRPGIYPETKNPDLYPGIEVELKNELERLGWYADNLSSLKTIETFPGRIKVGNSPARVMVQTFSPSSLQKLEKAFPRLIPFCFLIGIGVSENIDKQKYENWINFALTHKAVAIGPCIYEKNGMLGNLLLPWMYDLIKEKKLLIHGYTFNTEEQIEENIDLVDGFFTNQTDVLINYLIKTNRKPHYQPSTNIGGGSNLLDILGYK